MAVSHSKKKTLHFLPSHLQPLHAAAIRMIASAYNLVAIYFVEEVNQIKPKIISNQGDLTA